MNKAHGSPYDRGTADYYYSRAMKPHKKIGLDRVYDLTDEEIEEYYQGNKDAEELGDQKEWN